MKLRVSTNTTGKPWPRWVRMTVLLGVICVSGAGAVYVAMQEPVADQLPKALPLEKVTASAPAGASFRFDRLDGPPRTVVRDANGAVVATMTDGARTVALTGPARSFKEPAFTTAAVNTTVWVRLLDQPWEAGAEKAQWFRPWLDKVLTDQSPDVLAVAMEYLNGAPAEKDAKAVRFRGDAQFGPVAAGGAGRLEQSDFLDYLGLTWTFPDAGARKPKPAHLGALDCSGFVRMVYGYRLGYPLLGTNEAGQGLPRRAFAIAESGPGALVVPNRRQRTTEYGVLQPGDLVFFEVEQGEDQLDHAGIYLGLDSDGHHRFVSSRERANGPTFGDLGGTSLLDDGGMYSRGFRAARRI
ncbi:NlpC/P60 family protein [Lentzea tibetensis]|nr:NlpC/P60 family protein [Lentzea tibetensis]